MSFKEEVMPLASEPIFAETVNSTLIGTGLQVCLTEHQIRSLAIVWLNDCPLCVHDYVHGGQLWL
jgi:hypothetical protein